MTSPAVKLEDAQAANVPLEQPTVILYSRPPKKRKTRAEQLPEPVTNLPPHKRAKTEAEKDQRKLERVKRNRVAARNSREGKRKEIENYAVELEKARHIISWYESRYGPPPPEHLMLNVRIVRGL
ncbi:hypothetical protein K470DRAFT_254694 [Piedraia hortae CBS 480.64]|uniref:BZIP domain-containing protein n=1 Tax=Piedraia hortae CBS 480.64 TaxID=1314780 RepID=A0A6A7C8F6_9PEZI|nr:hypothetical protein K470DRAFT_254694 [Piedraia hortae CBS 480.64]